MREISPACAVGEVTGITLDELGGIREVTNLYEAAPRSRSLVVTRTLSRLSDTQRQLYDLLQLDLYRAW